MIRPLLAATAAVALVASPTIAAEGDAIAKANGLVDEGLAFLDGERQENGTWQADERVPPAVTALVLRAMVGSDARGPDDPAVKQGYDALVAQQVADGGIYSDLLANYNTAIAVSALAAANDEAGDDRYRETIDKAVDYLRRLQWTPETQADFADEESSASVTGEDDAFYGGWGYGGRSRGAGRPDLSNAAMALEALHDAGVPADDPAMERARLFVSRIQNRSESNAADWAGDDGGFVYGPSDDRQGESQAGEYTTPDGDRRLRSYGSMTYAGLKSMIYAGLDASDPRVQSAVEWIGEHWTLDENPGMAAEGEDRAEWGLYYTYLVLGRALDAYDDPTLDTAEGEVDWRVALIDELASRQNADGSWTGQPKWRENDPVMTTAYSVIALNAAVKDLREHPVETPE